MLDREEAHIYASKSVMLASSKSFVSAMLCIMLISQYCALDFIFKSEAGPTSGFLVPYYRLKIGRFSCITRC